MSQKDAADIRARKAAAVKKAAEKMQSGSLLHLLLSVPAMSIAGIDMPLRATLPRIECMDGESISVQAGRYLYSTPRTDEGPWTAVEVGYPSVSPGPAILEYTETPDMPCSSVYGYVPIWLVEAFIAAHGGINYAASFNEEKLSKRW